MATSAIAQKLLSPSIYKNLSDKLFLKRKAAADEVEKVVKELARKKHYSEIQALLKYFEDDFTLSVNTHTRKGGLLGIASVAIGLYEDAHIFNTQLTLPVLRLFQDNDSGVRYYAAESFYNIAKITRGHLLEFLPEAFDVLTRCIGDQEDSVRHCVGHCDRLLREIVSSAPQINLEAITGCLREQLYSTNPYTRQMIVSWIKNLHQIPSVDLSPQLPLLLEGLFIILGDPNYETRLLCQQLLDDILKDIVENPKSLDISAMATTLVVHCQLASASRNQFFDRSVSCVSAPVQGNTFNPSLNTIAAPTSLATDSVQTSVTPFDSQPKLNVGDALIQKNCVTNQIQQITALTWLKTFAELDSTLLIPHACSIIGAVLPCFCFCEDTSSKKIMTLAVKINEYMLKTIHNFVSKRSGKTTEAFDQDLLNVDAILDASCFQLSNSSNLTKLAALEWIGILIQVRPKPLFMRISHLVLQLMKLLCEPDHEILHATLTLIGSLCNHSMVQEVFGEDFCATSDLVNVPDSLITDLQNFDRSLKSNSPIPSNDVTSFMGYNNPLKLRFVIEIVKIFDSDEEFLLERGDLIITDLCRVLGADSAYCTLSAIVCHLLQPKAAFRLVQTLNRILVIQPPLHILRNRLKAIRTVNDCRLFERLYRAWCYNPVALLTLCLLSQNYEHCSILIKSFDRVLITVDVLIEIDYLVQMIESPVFSTMRMHLLSPKHGQALRDTLYCLLMCLPQSEAFHTLRNRLQCIPSISQVKTTTELKQNDSSFLPITETDWALVEHEIPFDQLLAHFHQVQDENFSQLHKIPLVQTSDDSISGCEKSQYKTSLTASSFLSQHISKLGIEPELENGTT